MTQFVQFSGHVVAQFVQYSGHAMALFQYSGHVLTLLQGWHSRGVPLQRPPKDQGKQDPRVRPPRGGPTYLTSQPPPRVHE